MLTLPLFWQALDDIPAAATDAHDWRVRLKSEFEHVRRYLRGTGELVESVDCPSPGGDGCPRRVVRLPSGKWRAVCGSREGGCEALDLNSDDLRVLAVDCNSLGADLAQAFGVTPANVTIPRGRILHLGQHAVAAGLSAPVLVLLPGPYDRMTEDELRADSAGVESSIILTPRSTSLPRTLRARLVEAGHLVLDLSTVTGLGAHGRIEAVQPAAVLLGPIRDRLFARLKAASGGPLFSLPAGTKWEQITLTLTSRETLVCTTPGFSRQVDPGELGMRSAKNNKTTLAWTMLVALASKSGVLVCREAAQEQKVRKQKQELSKRLRDGFGIAEDPVPWDKSQRAYVARFILRDDRPLVERDSRRAR